MTRKPIQVCMKKGGYALFDLVDLVCGIGIILIVVGLWLMAGWPIFLVLLGVALVLFSIILGSKHAKSGQKSGDESG